MHIVQLLSVLAWIISFCCTLYVSYYLITTLLGLRKKASLDPTHQLNRFLILIAARNEAGVIGNLIDSLSRQNYPRMFYDIQVIPNNCTDRTREVAREHGAQIFICPEPVRTKGDALRQAISAVNSKGHYDAYCIFDADNLVHPDFLKMMNRALASGKQLAQGYRDSKNPADTAISASYSIYYWIINRFYNNSRANLGLSAIISGSGFMISRQLLTQLGGWNTQTITEDLEITTQGILADERVAYVPEAITYDEQPLTMVHSWHQRLRWSTGIWQCNRTYFTKLIRKAVMHRDAAALDQMLFFLAPVMQLLHFSSFALNIVLQLMLAHYDLFPERNLYSLTFLSLDISYLLTTALAALTVTLERKQQPGLLKGILFYWFFLSSWVVINLRSVFKQVTTWTEIPHTRSIQLQDVLMNEG